MSPNIPLFCWFLRFWTTAPDDCKLSWSFLRPWEIFSAFTMPASTAGGECDVVIANSFLFVMWAAIRLFQCGLMESLFQRNHHLKSTKTFKENWNDSGVLLIASSWPDNRLQYLRISVMQVPFSSEFAEIKISAPKTLGSINQVETTRRISARPRLSWKHQLHWANQT